MSGLTRDFNISTLDSHGGYEPLTETLPVGIDDTEKDRVRNLKVSSAWPVVDSLEDIQSEEQIRGWDWSNQWREVDLHASR